MSKIMYMDEEYCGISPSTSTPTAGIDAQFDSDAHMNSTDMTSQEVSDFVDGISGQGANLADYVIEQGTSGVWTYRKWNSGISECWRTYRETTASAFSSTGYIYYRSLPSMTFPTGLFNDAPTIIANGYHGNIGGCAASATASSVTVMAWSAASTARAVTCYIHAIGTWK